MRVVELSTDRLPSPPKGGGGAIERYVYQISRELSRLGVEVHLISIGEKYCVKRNEIYFYNYSFKNMSLLEKFVGCVLARTTSELNRKIIYVNRILLKILHSIQEDYGHIDVVHNHYFTTSLAPIVFKELFNERALLVSHYHNVPKDNIINKFIAKNYDLHLAVSKFVKNKIIRRLKVSPQKVYVLYNSIDTSKFSCKKRTERALREKFGIDEDEIVLLYVGRITPVKGLHYLIEAYRIILKELSSQKITLLIAGPIGQFDLAEAKDVAYFKYIHYILKKYALEKRVKYMGFIPDIADVYSLADLVVVPSIWQDPCPSTVLEALASCKPVVAFPVGGIPEILEGLDYDFLSKKIDPESLAEKIIFMLKNIDKIDSKKLREHVDKKFSIRVAAERLRNILENHLIE